MSLYAEGQVKYKHMYNVVENNTSLIKMFSLFMCRYGIACMHKAALCGVVLLKRHPPHVVQPI